MNNNDEFFKDYEDVDEDVLDSKENKEKEQHVETASVKKPQHIASFSEVAYGISKPRGPKCDINEVVGKEIIMTSVNIRESKFEGDRDENGNIKKFVTIGFKDESGRPAYFNTGSRAIIDQLTHRNADGSSVADLFKENPDTELSTTIIQCKSKNRPDRKYYKLS